MGLLINYKEFTNMAIGGKNASSIAINGQIVWQKGGKGEWKLDEGGYIIGEDGKYYERWFDDSQVIDNNPIPDLNAQWVVDTVSGDLNIDKNFDYYMSNSNYHISSSYAQFKVSWSGLSEITFLYRSYGETNYDYLVINGLDKPQFTSNPSNSTSGILAHTYGKSTTTYSTITIPTPDMGEHSIWFCYRKDGSGDNYSDRAFVGIPNNLKEGELFVKSGKELRFAYVKSSEVEITREGYGKFKYYKTYYTPDNETSIKTDNFILGEEEPLTPITENYLRFDATTNDVHIGWTKLASVTDFEYAIDFDETWASFPDEGVDIPTGHSMYLRGNGITNTTTQGQRFTTSDKVECHGDVRSLINKTNFKNISSLPINNTFRYYFYNTDITTAPELNATSLRDNCYYSMFEGCSSLTTAPATLPATTLRDYCYEQMFKGCTSLTTAPQLPATTLRQCCYQQMFYNCTSLTTAPQLPATTLAILCYSYMFYNCTSLTTAPQLPATTLLGSCYSNMFAGCSSLTSAPQLPATTLTSQCYSNMFAGCSSLTSAPQLPATTLEQRCYQFMFEGCSSLTTAPDLPVTTLSDYCYYSMFEGCTSLTTAPQLPATTLVNSCYEQMFKGCTSLTTAPDLPATTLVNSCYKKMFQECSNLIYIKVGATSWSASDAYDWTYYIYTKGTFVKPSGVDIPSGTSGIPKGWTVQEY